jgi:putative nucleotidyltransferase with HDIG domain
MEQFSFAAAREKQRNAAFRMFDGWSLDPSLFESKETITLVEIHSIREMLCDTFFEAINQSTGMRDARNVSPKDIKLARRLIEMIQIVENRVVADPRRRPWNQSCEEHAIQVGILARLFAEQLGLDPNKLEITGLVHDIGRYASHHPWIHGIAGLDLLDFLGFHNDYKIVSYSHLEAGAPLLGATQDNWVEILNMPNLQDEVNKLSITEVIIVLADMSKKSIEEPEGSGRFVNCFTNPIDGVFVSGLRRLDEKRRRTFQQQNISQINIHDKKQLFEVFRIDPNMGIYIGLCWILMRRIVREGIVFEGKDGIIAKAQELYKK